MLPTARFSEVHEVLATLAPTTANGTVAQHNTEWFDIAEFHRVFFLLHVGTPAGASTIDLDIYEATDTDGSDTQIIATKSITQIVAADAGVYVGIEIRSEELDVNDKFHCLRGELTVGTTAYTYSLVAFGFVPRYADCDVTGYDELVP